MKTGTPELFRIWITKYACWQPRCWSDLPQQAIALELAEAGCFSAGDALAYIEGHNTAAIGRRDQRWAVAMPVVLAYEGDPRPGEVIFPQRMALGAGDV